MCPDYALINTKNNGGLVYPSKLECKILETQKRIIKSGLKENGNKYIYIIVMILDITQITVSTQNFVRGDYGLNYKECCPQYTVQDCFHYKQTCSCGSLGDKICPDHALSTPRTTVVLYTRLVLCARFYETQKGLPKAEPKDSGNRSTSVIILEIIVPFLNFQRGYVY